MVCNSRDCRLGHHFAGQFLAGLAARRVSPTLREGRTLEMLYRAYKGYHHHLRFGQDRLDLAAWIVQCAATVFDII